MERITSGGLQKLPLLRSVEVKQQIRPIPSLGMGLVFLRVGEKIKGGAERFLYGSRESNATHDFSRGKIGHPPPRKAAARVEKLTPSIL